MDAASISSSKLVLGQGRECTLSFFSPAKLNLFFRVLRRRSDGYHEIASLYQAISLGDKLSVSLADKDELTCDDPHLSCDGSNLIIQALMKFREKTGYHFPVWFHLEKRIPVQAGLGGGSGNAATALFALNALCAQPVPKEELQSWAAEFSSDASFFFSSGTAYCSSRGEIVEDQPPLPGIELWLAKPEEGLSTPLVYRNCRPESLPARDPRAYLKAIAAGHHIFFNDLEISAFELMPKLVQVRDGLLSLGFSPVVMTGSGTAFFCIGNVETPSLPGIRFYRAAFINRHEESWYSL